MLKSCCHCGRIHDSKIKCAAILKKNSREKQATENSKFRSTSRWRKKRDEIKELDLYLCQACKLNGRYEYNHLEVHHIVPLSENYELRLDNSNLITLCNPCHELAEAGQIARSVLKSIAQKR